MLALKGVIQGDTVVIEDDDIKRYSGKEVILTILDHADRSNGRIDLDQYTMPTKRGQNVEQYMERMRGDDRI